MNIEINGQNVISDNPPPPSLHPTRTPQRHHTLRTKIDMRVIPYQFSVPTYWTESRLFLSMPMNHLSPYLLSKKELSI